MPVRETTLLFGPRKSLVGVISDPPAGQARPDRPAFVLLNAGLLHRVGPNRLHVRLARRLAAAGFVVARFDFSGIGDSPPASDRSSLSERSVAEATACIDLLASSRGVRTVVVGGLCSGADNALSVASEDERVAGVLLIDPLSAASAGHMVHSYRERLLSPRSWLRLISGRSEAWSAFSGLLSTRIARRRENGGGPTPEAAPSGPRREAPGVQMRHFAERGGVLCLVYSAEGPAHYNYRSLVRPHLDGVPTGRVRVEVVGATDHVFTPLEAQARLIGLVADWALTVAAGGAGDEPPREEGVRRDPPRPEGLG